MSDERIGPGQAAHRPAAGESHRQRRLARDYLACVRGLPPDLRRIWLDWAGGASVRALAEDRLAERERIGLLIAAATEHVVLELLARGWTEAEIRAFPR